MKNVNIRFNDRNVKVISIIATVGIVLAILSIIVYLNFGAILSLINLDDTQVEENIYDPNYIPQIADNTNSSIEDVYYIAPEDILSTINIRSSYVRNFRIETYHGDDKFSTQYTLTLKDTLYKIESISSTVLFDGEYLHIKSDVYDYKTPSDGSEMYTEIGITSLSEVISLAEKYSSKFTLSGDKKSIYVEIVNTGKSTKSVFEISVETGIVVSEAHYYNGIMNIKVITESIDVFGANNLPDDFFKVNE